MYRVSLCLLLPFLLIFATATHAQKTTAHADNDVVTYESTDAGKPYKKLLIAGFGTIPVRHFLDNLSGLLINHYTGKAVPGTYEYVGNKLAVFNNNLQAAIHKHQPDIALVIFELPEDPDTLTMKKNRDYMRWLLYPGVKYQRAVNSRRQVFSENLQAVLWEPGGDKVIWRGEIFVSGDAAKSKTFETISAKLIDEWLRLGILAGPPAVN
ncbi:hypothetical protein [Chitinophaga barathri]|nr:hypothetical protein [Chitinophaga barathri]